MSRSRCFVGKVATDKVASGLAVGARVRLTPIAVARHPRLSVPGTIRGTAGPNGYRVLFDGNRTMQTIHRSYLEPLPGPTDRKEAGGRAARSIDREIYRSGSPPGRGALRVLESR